MEFYEIVVQLPNDYSVLSDGFIDAFTSTEVPPVAGHWDTTVIDRLTWKVGDVFAEQIVAWATATAKGKTPAFFIQEEQGEEYVHLHCCIETVVSASHVLGRYVNKLKNVLSGVLEGYVHKDDWITINKSGGAYTKNKVCDLNYITFYLVGKTQPDVLWAWSNIDRYQAALLDNEERKRLLEEYIRENPPKKKELKTPVVDTANAQKYMDLIDWLVEKGITTEKQWLLEDRTSFRSHQAGQGTARHIKEALKAAAQEILLTKCAKDYLVVKDQTYDDIEDNRIYRIMKMNGYDPHVVAAIFSRWCNREYGKRNTVWLHGPATTGKTNIAEAIAHAVPFYGCVNWTNETFPFNDCVNKLIIWWEEGKMTAKTVETAKAILGGSKVRVDQKCRGSEELEPTPVIITSNTNMCWVIDGNTTTYEHKTPLQERMFKLELTTPLSPDFGKITKREVRQFFSWGAAYEGVPEPVFQVPKTTSQAIKRAMTSTEQSPPLKVQKVASHSLTQKPHWTERLPEDVHLHAYRKWKAERDQIQKGGVGTTTAEESSEGEGPFYYKQKCSKHLHLEALKYQCLECSRANWEINNCRPHGVANCKECFPINENA
ncbi:Rep78 [avian adeno-associated virus BR_DF12]|uniref:Rep78 n=1 Tax=avian adeno-associated virus BR_DF12 TaxID=3070174 RepID=A0A5C0PWF0_9VIRU|nr:Rep78 [Avian adeno-associated virus]QEJ80808.1 Rep78 [avian adeno-associated virus BR_DF12]